ncbi:PASTA domain-containing protein [uncultured Nocardioides sp.]|uniref:PASTA domain-containing protein n=1 Tax=uncultured Nocardioides sp. TaxID=198441 RepID=UPI00262AC5B5|nr:PASTA domain-containing protein [uncultured Nocardioides sp.]
MVVLALVATSSLLADAPPDATVIDSAAQDTTSSQAPSEQPVTVVEEAAEPEADVPDVLGEDPGSARRLLRRSGLTLGSIKRVWSKEPDGTVLRQGLEAGTEAAVGTAVSLVVSKLIPKVPGTAGRLRAAALDALESAGYRVVISTERRSSGNDGAVLRQSPQGGAFLKPGSVVRLVVADVVPPAPAPAPVASCTPGYDPCLTPMSDYDCAGGSGDGPGYTGPVRVTGTDPYGLDNDGDGYACEG